MIGELMGSANHHPRQGDTDLAIGKSVPGCQSSQGFLQKRS
jgi:hypothetical protein